MMPVVGHVLAFVVVLGLILAWVALVTRACRSEPAREDCAPHAGECEFANGSCVQCGRHPTATETFAAIDHVREESEGCSVNDMFCSRCERLVGRCDCDEHAAFELIDAARHALDRRADPECSFCGNEGPHDHSCSLRPLEDALKLCGELGYTITPLNAEEHRQREVST